MIMIAKQIIIDGVDVSECIFHSLTTMGYTGYNYCKYFECVCECHNDCYYKRLKRKEQEVQQAIDNYVQLDLQRVKEYNELVDLYKAKEQEYEKLKQTLTEIKDYCNKYSQNSIGFKKYILQKISEVLNDRQKQS